MKHMIKGLPLVLATLGSTGALLKSEEAKAGLIEFNPNTAITAECKSSRDGGINLYQELSPQTTIGVCNVDDSSVLFYGNMGEDNYFSFMGFEDLFNGNFFNSNNSTEINYSITTPSNVFLDHNSFLLPNDYIQDLELLVTMDSTGYKIDDILESGNLDFQTFDDSFRSTNYFNNSGYNVNVSEVQDTTPTTPANAPGTLALLLGASAYAASRRKNK